MTYKTHLTVSTSIAIPTLFAFNELNIIALCGVLLGSLLPDIDHPKSFIGRKVYPIAYLLNKQFSHRGEVHSLIPVIAFAILGLYFHVIFLVAIAFGFLLHLIEDGFSVSGIRWLQPFKKKNYRLPYDWMKYRTGEGKEKIILLIAVVIVLIEIVHYRAFSNVISHAITTTRYARISSYKNMI